VVDGAALEKRWAAICLVGSNPTLSAERCWSGLSGAPGERVSSLATVGSNPTLSATIETCQQETVTSNGPAGSHRGNSTRISETARGLVSLLGASHAL
jgi:hypothetical protein